MSQSLLKYTMFQDVFFPPEQEESSTEFGLRQMVHFDLGVDAKVLELPMVVFDLETTGLDPRANRIIEIGAQKILNGRVIAEFETFVDPQTPLPEICQQITGITPDMVVGQPVLREVLPKFFSFISGSVLVAHNASFDMGFVRSQSAMLGYDFDWPSLCTLKLAREFLSSLPRKNLDTLAEHYGLSFEARHRSIGDVKVTAAVLEHLLKAEAADLMTWKEFAPYRV